MGPSVRARLRLSAATSSGSDVSGRGAADTFTAAAFSPLMTRAQLDPSAHAPWASTTLTSFAAFLNPLIFRPRAASSSQLSHPADDGPPELVRRVFLDVVAPRDLGLGQRWQSADEGEILPVGEDRTRLGPDEYLGHTASSEPVGGSG